MVMMSSRNCLPKTRRLMKQCMDCDRADDRKSDVLAAVDDFGFQETREGRHCGTSMVLAHVESRAREGKSKKTKRKDLVKESTKLSKTKRGRHSIHCESCLALPSTS